MTQCGWQMLSLSQHNLLAYSCNDEGAPNICKKDPTTDHRLYEIQVTATDQAGNEGETTCTIIIFTTPSQQNSFCQDFAVHAGTTVTFAGVSTSISGGNVGVSPGTSVIGMPTFDGGEVATESAAFATDVLAAHTEAMRVRSDAETMGIEIGGKTFTARTYRSGSAINIADGTTVSLDGLNKKNPEFLFQASSTLVTAANTVFILTNGNKVENVVWALGTASTLGANSVLEGSILAGKNITFGSRSELHGCALALSAITFESEGSVIASGSAPPGLDSFADAVLESVKNSTQRFDLASLALECPTQPKLN
jgi:hypothetical protein